MVWLVLAGPAVVVLAAIYTAVLAIQGADEVITTPVAQGHPDVAQGVASRASEAVNPGLLPAVQGRNHAATPVPR